MTALFADVVGSTTLGERLAPEEVKAVVGECLSRMCRVVESFGATIGAYMGDGIAAFFGVPTTHEDDVQRAAAASLDLLAEIDAYAREVEEAWGIESFGVRLGINSGPAAVGTVGAAAPQQVALGDAVNVAARLQAAAEPGSVLVGERTAEQLSQTFALHPLGEHQLKGRAAGVAAFRLDRARPAPVLQRRTSIVGRDTELARIGAVLADVRLGRGRVANLIGEPGIGKSALLRAARASVDDVLWLEGSCAPYGQRLYAPFAEMLRSWLSLEGNEPNLFVRTRLRAQLSGSSSDGDPLFPYLSWILGVATPDVDRMAQAAGFEEFGIQLKSAYRRWIAELAAARPLVLAIENLHWAEPSTRILAEELLPLVDEVPVLVFATTRKDAASEGWRFVLRTLEGYPHRVVTIELDGLDHDASAELIRLSGGASTQAAADAIVERAEGNPLYIEELTRADRPHGVDPARMNVPAPLHGLLISRLDALPPRSRRLAQIASVAGRSISVQRLAQLVEASQDLHEDVLPLLRHDLWREVHTEGRGTYRFKHWLVRQAAYTTLSQRDRANIHAAIAEILQDDLAAGVERSSTEIAYHLQCAGELAQAVSFLESAARRAAEAGELAEAIDFVERCLLLLTAGQDQWTRLGEFLARLQGRSRDFEGALRTIESLRPFERDGRDRARLALLRVAALMALNRPAEAHETVCRIETDHTDTVSDAMVRLARATAATGAGRYGDALDALRNGFPDNGNLPIEVAAEHSDLLVGLALRIGDRETAVEESVESERLSLMTENPTRKLVHELRTQSLRQMEGRLADAKDGLTRLRDAARFKVRAIEPAIISVLAWVYIATGDLEAADAQIEELIGLRDPRWDLEAAAAAGARAVASGAAAGAGILVTDARQRALSCGAIDQVIVADQVAVELAALEGKACVRAAALSVLAATHRAMGRRDVRAVMWRELAKASLEAGLPRRAEAEARLAIRCAESSVRYMAIAAWRVIGHARERRTPGSGVEPLEHALHLAREMGTRLDEAHTLVSLGDLGLTRDRLATLHEARDIFRECDAVGYLERLEQRLAGEPWISAKR